MYQILLKYQFLSVLLVMTETEKDRFRPVLTGFFQFGSVLA